MKHVLFTGACTALVTPFLNGEVNYPMMERLLQRQRDAGIDTVVVCGTTGESPTLSDKEKLPFLMALASSTKKNNISFSGEEVSLIIEVIKEYSSPEELSKMNKILSMFSHT